METTAVGPKHVIENKMVSMEGVSFVQEQLFNLTDMQYCKLTYAPVDGWSLQVFVNGLLKLRDIDYTADSKTIKFKEPLMVANAVVAAVYVTASKVVEPISDPIDFNVPTMNVRISQAGTLQILHPTTGLWHDLVPVEHPIDGSLVYLPDQDNA